MYQGFLRIAYTGATGSGLGVFALRDGSLVGADTGGGIYSGSYHENQDTRTVEFAITTPVNVPIVASVLQDDIGTEKPTLVETPLGPVNILLKKIADFP